MNPWGCLVELPHFSVPPGNGRGDLRGLLQSAAQQGLQQLLSSGRLAYRGWPLGAAGTRGPRLLEHTCAQRCTARGHAGFAT